MFSTIICFIDFGFELCLADWTAKCMSADYALILEKVCYTNLVFKCRINKLSLSKVCKGEKSLHSLPRVAIALAEAQAMVLFFNE